MKVNVFKKYFIIIFTSLVPVAATAQEQVTELTTIEVRGDFLGHISEEEIQIFPGSRTVIRLDSAKQKGDEEIKETVRRIPGLISSKSNGTGGNGSSLNIGVRGLTQRLSPRSTVLLDGIPLAVAPYGQPQLSLAPVTLGALDAIDVVRGGGSVRYGPQNVGGIINFVTRAIPDKTRAEITFRGNYFDGGKDELQAGGISAFVGGPAGSNTGFALLYGGKHGSTWREHSKQDIDNLIVKGEHLLNKNHRLYGRVLYYNAETKLPGGLDPVDFNLNPFQSSRPHDEFEGERKELVVGYEGNFGADLKLDLKTFYNDSFRQFIFARGKPAEANRLDRLPRSYEVQGLEGRLAKGFKLASVNAELGFGLRHLREDAKEQRFRRSHPAGANPFDTAEVVNRDSDNETRANALFTDLRLDWGKVKVIPGIRFEDVTISRKNNLTGFSEEIDYDELLPSIGVNYALTDVSILFASYNRSFGSVQHLQLNLQDKANTLEAELADTIEFGARFNSNNFSSEATLFYIDFDNQLAFNSNKGFWENRGKTEHRGLELAGAYNLGDNIQLYGNYTYLEATDEELNKGNDLEFTSEHVGLLGLEYLLDSSSFFIETYGQSSQFADPENTVEESADGGTGKIPGFGITNIGASYSSGNLFSVSGGIKNIFDKQHFSRSRDTLGRGKYLEQPRTVYVSIGLNF